MRVATSPVERINDYNRVEYIRDSNETIATRVNWNLATLRTL